MNTDFQNKPKKEPVKRASRGMMKFLFATCLATGVLHTLMTGGESVRVSSTAQTCGTGILKLQSFNLQKFFFFLKVSISVQCTLNLSL